MRTRPRPDPRKLFPALLATALVALTAPQSTAQVPAAPIVTQQLPGPAQPTTKRPVPQWDATSVLVKFKAGTSSLGHESSLRRHGATEDGAAGATGYTVARLDGGDPQQAVRDFQADPEVQDAQLNYLRHAMATPNDPGLSEGFQEYLRKIRALAAWDQSKGSTAKMIAILDTGIDIDHPDLATRIRAGYNAITGGTNVVDDNGHGTFVAGVAGAITNNGRGIAGAAWNTGLQPIKVLDADGVGTDADVAEGITWAADHGASVLNLSLGGPADSAVLHDAIDYALSKDKVIVVSAGNDYGPFANYPAAYSGVLAVTATDNASNFAAFSSFGWWVDVAAPGTAITSTFPGTEELYATGAGTSFAAPLVAGVALLVRVKYPTWKQGTVFNRIRDTARDYGPRGFDPFYGKGRLDAFAALGGGKLAPAVQPVGDAYELNPTPDRARAITGGKVSASISPEGDVDWFYWDVPAAGSVTFTVTPPAFNPNVLRALEMDPVLEVYGPDLEPLGRQDSGFLGTAESFTAGVPAPGRYFARVSNYNGARTPSNYAMEVTTSAAGTLTPSFEPRFSRAVPDSASSVLLQDVTGDGRTDALVTAVTGGELELRVFPQLDSGFLAPTPSQSLATAAPTSSSTNGGFALGRIDGDSLVDAVVAVSNGIDIFYGASGGLQPATHIPTPLTYDTRYVKIADADGDGDRDIFVLGFDSIALLTNTGSGFSESHIASYPEPSHLDFEVGDVTNDGRADVVAFTIDRLHVFEQQPDGSFPLTGDYNGRPYGYPQNVELADLNGDGRTDVATSQAGGPPPYSDGWIGVYLQDASGALQGAQRYTVGALPGAMVATDLNGDGRDDLAVTHQGLLAGQPRTTFAIQRPDGTLALPSYVSLALAQDENQSFAAADISDDGRVDLVGVGPDLYFARQVGPPAALWVRDHTPADFSLNISPTISPKVEFTRDIDPASINATTVQFLNANTLLAIAATRTYDAATRTVTINPTPTLARDTPFLIKVNGVKDTAGTSLTLLYSFRFKTAV